MRRERFAAVRLIERPAPFDPSLAELALRFLVAPPARLNEALQELLEALTRTTGVDRCGLALFSEDGRSLPWTHGFAMPGVPGFHALDVASLLPWLAAQVRAGRTLALSSLPEDLPAEAKAEAEFVTAIGLRSHLTLPLKAGDKVLGFLGLSCFRASPSWTPELISSLEVLASTLANVLERQRAEERLRTAENIHSSVLAAIATPVLVLDGEGRVIEVSAAWTRSARCADCPDARVHAGVDYLEACAHGSAERLRAAAAVPEGVRAVLGGKRDRFETLYHCERAPRDFRQVVTVTPRVGARAGVVIVQTDVAELERARSEVARGREQVQELKGRLDAESAYLQKEVLRAKGFDEIVGASALLSQVLHRVEQVAAADSPVLILGETGTGKDMVARAIHDRSRRKNRPLVTVNCAALPDALIESEMFGYEKGAFTGAVTRTFGRFEMANGGSILLDEIGELPLGAQAKLLRVLEGGTFERLGSSRTIHVNVRVIAATNRDLEKEVREGRFRADLYYRLNVFPITVPALRDRPEDIPLLVWHFINAKQGILGRAIERVPDRLMRALESYGWPGNVRELENVIERALILTSNSTLTVDASFLEVLEGGARPEPAATALDDVQRAHIESILRQCGWRVAGKGNAADRLGLKRGTLQFRMKKLGIRRPEA